MSQFNEILRARNFEKHTGEPLWKYDISDIEFFQLKKVLSEIENECDIDPKDCALFYAEWWKRAYNGGSPSKKDVLVSLGSQMTLNEESFFQHAKRGARLLGIKWIQSQNTFYFRTLLLQGGLPITYITNNSGSYKTFLLKILELSPTTIDDFAFDLDITRLLPSSSRNDTIYECCLEIVKAIINEDEKFLKILDNNQELQSIRNELNVKKQTLQLKRRTSKVKCAWVIEPHMGQIRLYLGFPDTIDADIFTTIFMDDDKTIQLEYEYKLFLNDNLICKFKKKADGSYKTIWINNIDLIWDGTEQLPDIYLINAGGNKSGCKHLVTNLPNLEKPSLWTKYTDLKWILEKGRHTSQNEGFVLSPITFTTNNTINPIELTICCKQFNWVEFQNSIEFINSSDRIQFKTDSKKIDWYIVENKPNWIKHANYPIVRRKPKVLVYDQEGSIIHKAVLHWRQKNHLVWNYWDAGTMPTGLLEVKISIGDIVETDHFFNISEFDLKTSSSNLQQAEVELIQNQFIFQINEDEYIEITTENSIKFHVQLRNNAAIPRAIRASIKQSTQNTPLRFEMLPPFKGVAILDNDGNVLPDGYCFTINNLYGHRLMSNQPNLVVNIYNRDKSSIIISKSLIDYSVPLREFEDKILQLASLSDAMGSETEIIFEICENLNFSQPKIRTYRFREYNNKINCSINEGHEINITIAAKEQPDLYAAPVDCEYKDLILYDLVNHNGRYNFRNGTWTKKFVLFSNKEASVKIRPALICMNPSNELESPDDRNKKIQLYRNLLQESKHTDDIWQKLLSYYNICTLNNLPYSTFDVLRALGGSSLVAAKAYVFLACFDESQAFVEEYVKSVEDDIGFAFHWINKGDWVKAMEWIGCFTNNDLIQKVSAAIKNHFQNLYPADSFKQISNFIFQGTQPSLDKNFHLKRRVIDMRSSLGARVLNELPQKWVKIPEEYKFILPVDMENANVKIMLKSPLAVALSIDGKDSAIWKEDEERKRYVKYVQQLHPGWYGEAINYCLLKLKNMN